MDGVNSVAARPPQLAASGRTGLRRDGRTMRQLAKADRLDLRRSWR